MGCDGRCNSCRLIHQCDLKYRRIAAAEMVATRKMAKYADLPASYLFQPVALETLGPIIDSAVDFLSELGSRIGTASLPEAFRDDTAF